MLKVVKFVLNWLLKMKFLEEANAYLPLYHLRQFGPNNHSNGGKTVTNYIKRITK